MSYQRERDEFIVRMTREGLPYDLTVKLLRAATTLNRYAEWSCSSEAANRDRVPCPATRKKPGECLCDLYHGEHSDIPRIDLRGWQLEQRLIKAMPAGWTVVTQGDPRSYVLRAIPPSYAERHAGRDQWNRDDIGVPCAPMRRLGFVTRGSQVVQIPGRLWSWSRTKHGGIA